MSLYGIPQVFNESVSNVTATNSVELGTRRSEGGIDYIYVYNVGAATIPQGCMGFIPVAVASSVANYSVVVSNAASQAGSLRVVGVAHNADIATTRYGWLATRGIVYGVPDATATSINSGVDLVPGVDGGFVAAAATLSTGLPIATTINSFITTVGSGKIAFRSPLFG